MNGHFNNALANLQKMLGTMSAYAEEAVLLSGKSVTEVSLELANLIIEGDEKIDSMEIEVEEECLKILALHQPVASDLRQIITILKVNNELERIGDLAVNMAEVVGIFASFKDTSIEKFDFSDMLNIVSSMLKDALDSLTYHNVELAKNIIMRDDKVDQLYYDNNEIVRKFILKYPDSVQYYLNILTISRCLERIADIATNIAEDVIYLELGKIIRHCHEMEK